MSETHYYAKINGRDCNDLNAEINNIKCPICGQKMDVVQVGYPERTFNEVSRKTDHLGHLWHAETWYTSVPLKWACMNCTAELTATAKMYRTTRIDLDANL